MKDPIVVNKFFELTKKWEEKKKSSFIGASFKEVRKENWSHQDVFLFTPIWINQILVECGKIPNKYSFETAVDRLNHLKKYPVVPIDQEKNLFNKLFEDKTLAAGAFIVSMDLECRGVQGGRISLCMSEKFKDFLECMLKVAKFYNWTNNKELYPVSVEYSKKLGIKASPQFELKINIEGLKEIYGLAGPLTNPHKNECINFHVNRSKNYINLGCALKKNNSREKILNAVRGNKDLTTTHLQFVAGIGGDVVLGHLHRLEKEGFVQKERKGQRYIWNAIVKT